MASFQKIEHMRRQCAPVLLRCTSLVAGMFGLASWDVSNFLVLPSLTIESRCYYCSVPWISYLMMSFAIYCTLFGILVFCPETGEICYL